jgi:N-carbamoyl-L-amino-acid hydrolase
MREYHAGKLDNPPWMRVREERQWERLMALAEIGATTKGGVHRLALTEAEVAARRMLLDWARALDLAPATDAIGNLFFRFAGREGDATPVLTGSHIDTQPTGGKFDGAYGVVAAFEAVEAMRDAGFTPRRSITIVAWLNEEGSRFSPGMMGSEAFVGARPLLEILAVRDAQGITVEAALSALQSRFPDLPRVPLGFPVTAYVEAHIEQGPLLEAAGVPIGIVTGIQGTRRFRITVEGEEAHAGTALRSARKDALFAAVDIVAALRAAFADADDLVKFTIGLFNVSPNAPSVVPSRVLFSIDLRHPSWPVLHALGDQIQGLCTRHVGPCHADVREIATARPVEFPQTMCALIADAAAAVNARSLYLLSAAGHDARQLQSVCPSGMIFVPCEKGLSHNEHENCASIDLWQGTRVLTEVLIRLASG